MDKPTRQRFDIGPVTGELSASTVPKGKTDVRNASSARTAEIRNDRIAALCRTSSVQLSGKSSTIGSSTLDAFEDNTLEKQVVKNKFLPKLNTTEIRNQIQTASTKNARCYRESRFKNKRILNNSANIKSADSLLTLTSIKSNREASKKILWPYRAPTPQTLGRTKVVDTGNIFNQQSYKRLFSPKIDFENSPTFNTDILAYYVDDVTPDRKDLTEAKLLISEDLNRTRTSTSKVSIPRILNSKANVKETQELEANKVEEIQKTDDSVSTKDVVTVEWLNYLMPSSYLEKVDKTIFSSFLKAAGRKPKTPKPDVDAMLKRIQTASSSIITVNEKSEWVKPESLMSEIEVSHPPAQLTTDLKSKNVPPRAQLKLPRLPFEKYKKVANFPKFSNKISMMESSEDSIRSTLHTHSSAVPSTSSIIKRGSKPKTSKKATSKPANETDTGLRPAKKNENVFMYRSKTQEAILKQRARTSLSRAEGLYALQQNGKYNNKDSYWKRSGKSFFPEALTEELRFREQNLRPNFVLGVATSSNDKKPMVKQQLKYFPTPTFKVPEALSTPLERNTAREMEMLSRSIPTSLRKPEKILRKLDSYNLQSQSDTYSESAKVPKPAARTIVTLKIDKTLSNSTNIESSNKNLSEESTLDRKVKSAKSFSKNTEKNSSSGLRVSSSAGVDPIKTKSRMEERSLSLLSKTKKQTESKEVQEGGYGSSRLEKLYPVERAIVPPVTLPSLAKNSVTRRASSFERKYPIERELVNPVTLPTYFNGQSNEISNRWSKELLPTVKKKIINNPRYGAGEESCSSVTAKYPLEDESTLVSPISLSSKPEKHISADTTERTSLPYEFDQNIYERVKATGREHKRLEYEKSLESVKSLSKKYPVETKLVLPVRIPTPNIKSNTHKYRIEQTRSEETLSSISEKSAHGRYEEPVKYKNERNFNYQSKYEYQKEKIDEKILKLKQKYQNSNKDCQARSATPKRKFSTERCAEGEKRLERASTPRPKYYNINNEVTSIISRNEMPAVNDSGLPVLYLPYVQNDSDKKGGANRSRSPLEQSPTHKRSTNIKRPSTFDNLPGASIMAYNALYTGESPPPPSQLLGQDMFRGQRNVVSTFMEPPPRYISDLKSKILARNRGAKPEKYQSSKQPKIEPVNRTKPNINNVYMPHQFHSPNRLTNNKKFSSSTLPKLPGVWCEKNLPRPVIDQIEKENVPSKKDFKKSDQSRRVDTTYVEDLLAPVTLPKGRPKLIKRTLTWHKENTSNTFGLPKVQNNMTEQKVLFSLVDQNINSNLTSPTVKKDSLPGRRDLESTSSSWYKKLISKIKTLSKSRVAKSKFSSVPTTTMVPSNKDPIRNRYRVKNIFSSHPEQPASNKNRVALPPLAKTHKNSKSSFRNNSAKLSITELKRNIEKELEDVLRVQNEEIGFKNQKTHHLEESKYEPTGNRQQKYQLSHQLGHMKRKAKSKESKTQISDEPLENGKNRKAYLRSMTKPKLQPKTSTFLRPKRGPMTATERFGLIPDKIVVPEVLPSKLKKQLQDKHKVEHPIVDHRKQYNLRPKSNLRKQISDFKILSNEKLDDIRVSLENTSDLGIPSDVVFHSGSNTDESYKETPASTVKDAPIFQRLSECSDISELSDSKLSVLKCYCIDNRTYPISASNSESFDTAACSNVTSMISDEISFTDEDDTMKNILDYKNKGKLKKVDQKQNGKQREKLIQQAIVSSIIEADNNREAIKLKNELIMQAIKQKNDVKGEDSPFKIIEDVIRSPTINQLYKTEMPVDRGSYMAECNDDEFLQKPVRPTESIRMEDDHVKHLEAIQQLNLKGPKKKVVREPLLKFMVDESRKKITDRHPMKNWKVEEWLQKNVKEGETKPTNKVESNAQKTDTGEKCPREKNSQQIKKKEVEMKPKEELLTSKDEEEVMRKAKEDHWLRKKLALPLLEENKIKQNIEQMVHPNRAAEGNVEELNERLKFNHRGTKQKIVTPTQKDFEEHVNLTNPPKIKQLEDENKFKLNKENLQKAYKKSAPKAAEVKNRGTKDYLKRFKIDEDSEKKLDEITRRAWEIENEKKKRDLEDQKLRKQGPIISDLSKKVETETITEIVTTEEMPTTEEITTTELLEKNDKPKENTEVTPTTTDQTQLALVPYCRNQMPNIRDLLNKRIEPIIPQPFQDFRSLIPWVYHAMEETNKTRESSEDEPPGPILLPKILRSKTREMLEGIYNNASKRRNNENIKLKKTVQEILLSTLETNETLRKEPLKRCELEWKKETHTSHFDNKVKEYEKKPPFTELSPVKIETTHVHHTRIGSKAREQPKICEKESVPVYHTTVNNFGTKTADLTKNPSYIDFSYSLHALAEEKTKPNFAVGRLRKVKANEPPKKVVIEKPSFGTIDEQNHHKRIVKLPKARPGKAMRETSVPRKKVETLPWRSEDSLRRELADEFLKLKMAENQQIAKTSSSPGSTVVTSFDGTETQDAPVYVQHQKYELRRANAKEMPKSRVELKSVRWPNVDRKDTVRWPHIPSKPKDQFYQFTSSSEEFDTLNTLSGETAKSEVRSKTNLKQKSQKTLKERYPTESELALPVALSALVPNQNASSITSPVGETSPAMTATDDKKTDLSSTTKIEPMSPKKPLAERFPAESKLVLPVQILPAPYDSTTESKEISPQHKRALTDESSIDVKQKSFASNTQLSSEPIPTPPPDDTLLMRKILRKPDESSTENDVKLQISVPEYTVNMALEDNPYHRLSKNHSISSRIGSTIVSSYCCVSKTPLTSSLELTTCEYSPKVVEKFQRKPGDMGDVARDEPSMIHVHRAAAVMNIHRAANMNRDPSSESFLECSERIPSMSRSFVSGDQLGNNLRDGVGHRFFRRPPSKRLGLVELKKESPPFESIRSKQDIIQPHPAQALMDLHNENAYLPPPPTPPRSVHDDESKFNFHSMNTEKENSSDSNGGKASDGGENVTTLAQAEIPNEPSEQPQGSTQPIEVHKAIETPRLGTSEVADTAGQRAVPESDSQIMNILTGPLGLVTGKMFKPPVLPPEEQVDPAVQQLTVERNKDAVEIDPDPPCASATTSVQSFENLPPIEWNDTRATAGARTGAETELPARRLTTRLHRRQAPSTANQSTAYPIFRGEFDPPDRRTPKIDSAMQTEKCQQKVP